MSSFDNKLPAVLLAGIFQNRSATLTYSTNSTIMDTIWAWISQDSADAHPQGRTAGHYSRDRRIEPFIALNRMTYERQGISMPYSAELVRRLDAACSARGVRRILLAEGADGTPHAALYLVWDAESAYSLMSGNDPRLRTVVQ